MTACHPAELVPNMSRERPNDQGGAPLHARLRTWRGTVLGFGTALGFAVASTAGAGDIAHSDAYLRGMFLYQNSYDYARARAELLRAATQDGLPEAAFYLAELYESGVAGSPPDPAAARRWYLFAAVRGHLAAQQRLAALYTQGKAPAEAEAAFIWYQHAAEQGDMLSMYALSQAYAAGRGIEADPYLAYKWLSIATSFGHPDAETGHAQLAPRLTPEMRARAEAEARDWERDWLARRPHTTEASSDSPE